jgi:hypothetical protein
VAAARRAVADGRCVTGLARSTEDSEGNRGALEEEEEEEAVEGGGEQEDPMFSGDGSVVCDACATGTTTRPPGPARPPPARPVTRPLRPLHGRLPPTAAADAAGWPRDAELKPGNQRGASADAVPTTVLLRRWMPPAVLAFGTATDARSDAIS